MGVYRKNGPPVCGVLLRHPRLTAQKTPGLSRRQFRITFVVVGHDRLFVPEAAQLLMDL
jgi:hypothetical protein